MSSLSNQLAASGVTTAADGRSADIRAGVRVEQVTIAWMVEAALAAAERAIDPLWSRLGGGCHLNRQAEAAIVAAGFVIARVDRFEFAPCALDRLSASHILGCARRP